MGVTDDDLLDFVQNDFQVYLEQWAAQQQGQILDHLDLLENEVERIGIGRPEFEAIKDPIKQLLRLMTGQSSGFSKDILNNYRMDGNPIIFDN